MLADGGNVDGYVSFKRQWIIEVSKSSEVWIRTKGQGQVHGHMHTSFVGYLLFQTE